MKSYTDIEQSKKLAKILPLESADLYYFLDPTPAGNIYHLTVQRVDIGIKNFPNYDEGDIPCWSLAALLKCLGKIKPQVYTPILFPSEGEWILQFVEYGHGNVCEMSCNNPVDACYELILKLHERKML